MLRIIDMLIAAAERQPAWEPCNGGADEGDGQATQADEVAEDAERSRSPSAMSRETVRADLKRMLDAFHVVPDQLSLYRQELIEAEHVCALCKHVGRCRAWHAHDHKGDAPRLFCANAAFFEEITPHPFWSETAPGSWHAEMRAHRSCVS